LFRHVVRLRLTWVQAFGHNCSAPPARLPGGGSELAGPRSARTTQSRRSFRSFFIIAFLASIESKFLARPLRQDRVVGHTPIWARRLASLPYPGADQPDRFAHRSDLASFARARLRNNFGTIDMVTHWDPLRVWRRSCGSLFNAA